MCVPDASDISLRWQIPSSNRVLLLIPDREYSIISTQLMTVFFNDMIVAVMGLLLKLSELIIIDVVIPIEPGDF